MLQNIHESSLTQTTPLQRSLEKYIGVIECQKQIPLHVINYAGYKTPFVTDAHDEFVYIHN